MAQRKPIVGLCGGIGAGKSRVAAEFERLGCVVIDSDRLNHEVLGRPEVVARLREWWSDGVVNEDGSPNRERIAEIVFADAGERRRLERLVYPLIAEMREAIIEGVREDPAVKAVILDSPLLFESKLDRLCDTIVFVKASRVKRLQRLRRLRDWSEEQLRERERWQKPLTEKRSCSEFVIDNDGSVEELRPQVIEVLGEIASRFGTRR